MMATAPTEHEAFTTQWLPQAGQAITVKDLDATLPPQLLPARVELRSTYAKRCGATWMEWYATHDDGIISLPDKPGDGEPSLRQLVGWLERHGYRETSASLEMPPIYERA
jgi:hypothetical protein